MKRPAQRGISLVVGLVLLSIVTLLGLAGASGAHVEQLLAQNEGFRENAASAASAGIEVALRAIVNSPAPEAVAPRITGSLAAAGASYDARVRFMGYETGLPQADGARLAGAHFEILSTGRAARNASDRQRANVMRVVEVTMPTGAVPCAPLAENRCRQAGEVWTSWQRVAPP
jgi:hypothetical protein